MTDLDQVLNKGDLLIIETGLYSDKEWSGPVKMLRNASKRELVEQFSLKGERVDWYNLNTLKPRDFLPWLIRTGYAERVDCTSWHVGTYDDFMP